MTKMKEKQLIDLTFTGSGPEFHLSRGWSGSSYHGNLPPSSIPPSSKSSVHSVRTRHTGYSRITSARSNITSAGRSQVTSITNYTFTSAQPSRLTSAVSRSSTAKKRRPGIMEKCPSPPPMTFEDLRAEISSVKESPGLTVWCLEGGRLQRVKSVCNGFFHQGNCYLILKVEDDDTKHLHIWHGSRSLKDDRDKLWLHAEDVDRILVGAAIMTCEYEGQETPLFLKHFQDGIVVCEGRTRQNLGRAVKYQKRLYVVKGRKYPVAICTECSLSAATPDVCLILDGYPRIYVKIGENVDFVSRVKAINLAKKIRTWQRYGKGHIVVIDKDERVQAESFLRKLSNDEGSILDTASPRQDNEQPHQCSLFRVTGDRVMYDMPLAATQPLQQKYLITTDSFLLDLGPSLPLYMWVGLKEDLDAVHRALHRMKIFTQHHGYPDNMPLCRISDGEEPNSFKALFASWRDKVTKERQVVRSYSVANIGRVLFSRSDRRTVPKLYELWSDDHFITEEGVTEIWKVDKEALVLIEESQHGIFFSNQCYIIMYKEKSELHNLTAIYFWIGSKASVLQYKNALKSAAHMDASMNHQTVMIQVLHGKEPKHFLSVLQTCLVVHDPDLPQTDFHDLEALNDHKSVPSAKNNVVCMYCVREFTPERMRVTQVAPSSSCLNSSSAFVILSKDSAAIWYGKLAKAQEREYAKTVLAYFCPNRAFDYDIFTEGKETSSFWTLIHYDGIFPKEFVDIHLERRLPRLLLCELVKDQWVFTNIPQFSQEDLCETDLLLLDTHDQLYLWCGNRLVERDALKQLELLQNFIEQDCSGRQIEDLQVWFVNQEHEPSTFVKYFKDWDHHGYGGSIAYAAARKCVRQENALIDPDCQMVNTAFVGTVKVSYKQLVKEEELPENVDLRHKEHHLSDREFTRVIQMNRAQFYRLPLWKQTQILRSARLKAPDTSSSDPS